MIPSWVNTGLGALGLLVLSHRALATNRLPDSPEYDGEEWCPERCSVAGPNTINWPVYHNLGQLQLCKDTMFFEFNIHDMVDDESEYHRIYACSSYSADWENTPPSTAPAAAFELVNASYEISWSHSGAVNTQDGSSLVTEMGQYLSTNYSNSGKDTIMFSKTGSVSLGLYMGKGLSEEHISSFALKVFDDFIIAPDEYGDTFAMQLCHPEDNGDHTFGIMVSGDGTFTSIQTAIQNWSKGQCLTLDGYKAVSGQAAFATSAQALTNTTRTKRSSAYHHSSHSHAKRATARSDCKTVQVASGDSCGSLATKCGISSSDFNKYNSDSKLCSSLAPGQHVCCSAGSMPDFSPKPNADGTCATYTVSAGDNCADIGAANSLTNKDIEGFNKNTWGWTGCDRILTGSVICLSKGKPPMPAPMSNAVCGPQKPGTKSPKDGTDIAKLNPCPLNACCDIWGQCGVTIEFCKNTTTGAPGTAKNGTNGCISNCGTEVVRSTSSASPKTIGYYEGYSLSSRECLYQDITQFDTTKYTHIHFAFATLTDDYEPQVGDILTAFEFRLFKELVGINRVLTFGGWDFSTDPSTYNIFREGVKPANRHKMAANIANFIKKHDLDGIDIDWEYPGAPDIPGIPAADKDDGDNFRDFLVLLKNLLPGKSVSIAAPSSYWYMKNLPMDDIGKIVDYIVIMTYDLHGQWDAGNKNSQDGCPSGMCLRSHVNLTETLTSLAMITKAGVPSDKVVVGISSYGRSFAMKDSNCYGPQCFYTGTSIKSNAIPGRCTRVAGYIADAELNELTSSTKRSNRINKQFYDKSSGSDIIIYDDNQWTAHMTPATKALRQSVYNTLHMGGTSDWDCTLQKFLDPPTPSKSWAQFRRMIAAGKDPYDLDPSGDYPNINCSNPAVQFQGKYSSKKQWEMLDCADAWNDAISKWQETPDRVNTSAGFTDSIMTTLHVSIGANCGDLGPQSRCDTPRDCIDVVANGGGAAGYAIWNSLVNIHQLYASLEAAITGSSAIVSLSMDDLENKFGPVQDNDNKWVDVLLDLVSAGTSMIMGNFFSKVLKDFTSLAEETQSTMSQVANIFIGEGTGQVKDLKPGKPIKNWTPEIKASFSQTMGSAFDAWSNIIAVAAAKLFSGDDQSVFELGTVIADGKFFEADASSTIDSNQQDTKKMVTQVFFAYAITHIWQNSGMYPFVLDSGYDCEKAKVDGLHLEEDTAKKTGHCYNNRQYYLVYPDGNPDECVTSCDGEVCDPCHMKTFSAPTGLDNLDGKQFAGIGMSDFITGSVRTYQMNGNKNGVAPNFTDIDYMQSFSKGNVTAPGFLSIPVCNAKVAHNAWDRYYHGDRSHLPNNYPCDPEPQYSEGGDNECSDSTFVNQTSEASPKVSDCLEMLHNLRDGKGRWTTTLDHQRQIASYKSCKFGVEAKVAHGNANYHVGAQDITDIVLDAIKKFAGGDRIGAKGVMKCNGNTPQKESVTWGLY